MSGPTPNATKWLYAEHPQAGVQTSGPLDDPFQRLVRWILDEAPADRLSIAAVYGERGSGKSSLLNRLRAAGEERSGSAGEERSADAEWREQARSRLVWPQEQARGEARTGMRVLDPAMSKTDPNELVFDLLELLSGVPRAAGEGSAPGRDNPDDPLGKARRAAARRAEPRRFLDLTKELAPSQRKLPEDLAQARAELAEADRDLREALTAWGRLLTGPPGAPRRLLLLVDDLDLSPHLAFATLDLLTRFLCGVPAVVVICADETTLLRAVEYDLQRTNPTIPALNFAYLHKFIPFAVRLWPWRGEEGVRLLKEGQEGVKPVWEPVFEDSPWALLRDHLGEDSERRTQDSGLRLRLGQGRQELFDTKFDEWLLGELLPRTPRLLKRVHNRWAAELLELGEAAQPPRWSERSRIQPLIPGLHPASQHLLLGLLLAVDVSWPQLELWSWVLAGSDLSLKLRPIARLRLVEEQRASDRNEGEADRGGSPSRGALPLWDPALELPSQVHRALCERSLILLARCYRALWDRVVRVEQVLAIGMDADAERLVAQLPGALAVPLALTDEGSGYNRPQVPRLGDRLALHEPRLRELETQLRGGLGANVLGKAPASVLCLLGWRLRYLRLNSVYNDHDGRLTPFPLPSPRLEARPDKDGLGFFSKTDQRLGAPEQEPRPGECVLVIDMLRKVSAADLSTFPKELHPVQARILQAKAMDGPLEPGHLRTVLQDLVDHITWMHNQEGVRTFHLALVCQDVVACALGRQLHSQGFFRLYEWERSAQRYLFTGLEFPAPPPGADPDELTEVVRDTSG